MSVYYSPAFKMYMLHISMCYDIISPSCTVIPDSAGRCL